MAGSISRLVAQPEDALKNATPQEHQKTFPQYAELIEEMLGVNKLMIEYAAQLQKVVKG